MLILTSTQRLGKIPLILTGAYPSIHYTHKPSCFFTQNFESKLKEDAVSLTQWTVSIYKSSGNSKSLNFFSLWKPSLHLKHSTTVFGKVYISQSLILALEQRVFFEFNKYPSLHYIHV